MMELFVILLWLDRGKEAFPYLVNCCGQLKKPALEADKSSMVSTFPGI